MNDGLDRQHGSQPYDRLILFARYPEPGQAKTRLIPALGAECAAEIQRTLTLRTLDVANRFCRSAPCDLEVRFTGAEPEQMQSLFGSEPRYEPQQGTSLGKRLTHAVSAAFTAGMRRVVVIGTDCPELEPSLLTQAFAELQRSDVVLGPALDGGYYLIGQRVDRPELFQNIDWSTDKVFQQTLDQARRLNCRVARLPPLSDVDYVEDLLACRRVGVPFAEVLPIAKPGLISVVIPTLNEGANIELALHRVTGQEGIEVLVADGGSTDGTVEIARRFPVTVVPVRAGRGRQMNAGASLASGEVLLFLHADTILPERFQEHVWSILKDGAVAGAFALRVDDPSTALRIVEWGINVRSRVGQRPYGDQGLFLRSETFHRLGGFVHWPLMEDYELCRRLRQHGRIQIAPASATTSARRWKKLGVFRTTLINQLCIAGLNIGVSPERLARWYAARKL